MSILGIPVVAEKHSTKIIPVANHSPHRLVHRADCLTHVPFPAITFHAPSVQKILLEHDTEIILRWVRHAHHDNQTALTVREVDALAELASADSSQDGTPSWP